MSPERVAALLGEGGPLHGRFTLDRVLGEDALGSRFRVIDTTETDRVGALRILHAEVSEAQWGVFEPRLERLATLEHPNGARLLEWGRHEDRPFVVFEQARGEPLAPLVDEPGGLDARTFVPIAAQILKVVGAAHARKIPLGALRPQSVLLSMRNSRANFVRVDEVGIDAVFYELFPSDELVRASYQAPELDREGHSPRTDVYSLGTLFYRMLTGELPYPVEDVAALREAQRGQVPPEIESKDQQVAAVEAGLQSLIHRALASDPAKRARNANALVELLIKAVPVAMFKLPPAGGVPRSAQSTSSGATLLTGTWQTLAEAPLDEDDDATEGSAPSTMLLSETTALTRRPGTPGPRPMTSPGTPVPGLAGAGAHETTGSTARGGVSTEGTQHRAMPRERGPSLWVGILGGMAGVFAILGVAYFLTATPGGESKGKPDGGVAAKRQGEPEAAVAAAQPVVAGKISPATPEPAPERELESDESKDATFEVVEEGAAEAPAPALEPEPEPEPEQAKTKKKTAKKKASQSSAKSGGDAPAPEPAATSDSGEKPEPKKAKKKSKSSEAFLPVGG